MKPASLTFLWTDHPASSTSSTEPRYSGASKPYSSPLGGTANDVFQQAQKNGKEQQ